MPDPLGEHLRNLRADAGLTQRELVALIGFTSPYISKVEGGRERPSDLYLAACAEAFQVDLEDLMLVGRRLPEDVLDVVVDKSERALVFLRLWGAGKITDVQVDRLLQRALHES